jgi:hypothetical protein
MKRFWAWFLEKILITTIKTNFRRDKKRQKRRKQIVFSGFVRAVRNQKVLAKALGVILLN